MSSKVLAQAIAEMADLPEDALTQVLTLDSRHPLRGETYMYLDPFEPAVAIM